MSDLALPAARAPRRPDRGLVAALALLPLIFLVPLLIGDDFVFHVFITICLYGALATAWNIVGGFAGQLSLGHAIFYGIGAYTAGLLVPLGVSPWLGMLGVPPSRPWWGSPSACPASGCAGRSSRWPPSPSCRSSGCWRCTSPALPAARWG
ncbi:ABC transporter permease subunit [Teichococcus aestuarii]|uniref:ABC transporter permease subunit n=1 Tax=Teichococcus aestuarii TaxID=568898 RepID=UPI0036161868